MEKKQTITVEIPLEKLLEVKKGYIELYKELNDSDYDIREHACSGASVLDGALSRLGLIDLSIEEPSERFILINNVEGGNE